ncbi:MAG: hypothetical protein FWD02_05665, partial [Bacteroidales bacterium]|nr:hypothetical protein [Bacteroidales bacterium]
QRDESFSGADIGYCLGLFLHDLGLIIDYKVKHFFQFANIRWCGHPRPYRCGFGSAQPPESVVERSDALSMPKCRDARFPTTKSLKKIKDC